MACRACVGRNGDVQATQDAMPLDSARLALVMTATVVIPALTIAFLGTRP